MSSFELFEFENLKNKTYYTRLSIQNTLIKERSNKHRTVGNKI